jgi:hypothetical protein
MMSRLAAEVVQLGGNMRQTEIQSLRIETR